MASKEERKARLDTKEVAGQPGVDEMQEALALVYGDRQASYGHPRDAYAALAKVWSGLLHGVLKRDLTAGETVLMMAALKLTRESGRPKHDNVVDLHGYGVCYSRVQDAAPADEDRQQFGR